MNTYTLHTVEDYYLHDHINSLRGNVWSDKTSLSLPLFFIEKALPSQESERPCILTRSYRFVFVSTILLCGFSNCLIHICCVVYTIQLQVKFSSGFQ